MIVSWRKAGAPVSEAQTLIAQSYGFSFSLPSKMVKKAENVGWMSAEETFSHANGMRRYAVTTSFE